MMQLNSRRTINIYKSMNMLMADKENGMKLQRDSFLYGQSIVHFAMLLTILKTKIIIIVALLF